MEREESSSNRVQDTGQDVACIFQLLNGIHVSAYTAPQGIVVPRSAQESHGGLPELVSRGQRESWLHRVGLKGLRGTMLYSNI